MQSRNSDAWRVVLAYLFSFIGAVLVILTFSVEWWIGYIAFAFGFLAIWCSYGGFSLALGVSDCIVGLMIGIMGSMRVMVMR